MKKQTNKQNQNQTTNNNPDNLMDFDVQNICLCCRFEIRANQMKKKRGGGDIQQPNDRITALK